MNNPVDSAPLTATALDLNGLFSSPRLESQAQLGRFFREVSRGSSASLFWDGAWPNRWSMIGLHPRQSICLDRQGLRITGDDNGFVPLEALCREPERLWEIFRGRSVRALSEDVAGDLDVPFSGGWMGYFGYGFARWCEPALGQPVTNSPDESALDKPALPDCLLYQFQDVLLIDWEREKTWLLAPDPAANYYQGVWEQLAGEKENKAEGNRMALPADLHAYARTFQCSFSEGGFETAVAALQQHIRQGEIYQANLSMQFRKRMALEMDALYRDLSCQNPSPFSALFKWPGGAILCNSPERLVQTDAVGCVQTRPIAGTRGRGQSGEEEERIARILRESPKEQAEHMMLVDLARNDLGRICEAGSVSVNELMALERYSHVTHLVSNVTGQLQPGKDVWDVLQAVFPAGTITGCPKIRCMTLLDQYEPVPRGPYTGSLGYLDPRHGTMDLNILIRSLYLQAVQASPDSCHGRSGLPVYDAALHAGAGIVADSVGAHEYRECLRKAAALLGVLLRHEQPACGSLSDEDAPFGV